MLVVYGAQVTAVTTVLIVAEKDDRVRQIRIKTIPSTGASHCVGCVGILEALGGKDARRP